MGDLCNQEKTSGRILLSLITYFLGWLGIHKFIRGKKTMGFVYLFTVGLFGMGWLVDIFLSVINIFKPLDYFEEEEQHKIKQQAELERIKLQKERLAEVERKEREIANKRIAEAEEKGLAHCPKCGSIQIQYYNDTTVIQGKNRTGAGVVTGLAINPVVGAVVGTSRKNNKYKKSEGCVCLNCGTKWKPISKF